MNIVITGSNGFVGENLTTYCTQQNYKVQRLPMRDRYWEASLPKIGDAIIHLAGKAHDTSNTDDASAYFTINRDLTIAIFDRFLSSDIRDFFYFSSVKAVADTVSSELFEEDLAAPKTPYGQSKRQAEQYLLSQELPKEKRLFIIRPCMIHGPGNKGNLNQLYKVVQMGAPWPLASFHNQRSFLGIQNLQFLIKSMLESDIPSGVYNFADDEPLSTNQVVTIISKNLGLKPRLLHLQPKLIAGVAKAGDLFGLPLNSERLKKLTESYVVSNAKLKKALQIDSLPFSVEEGLNSTVSSFKR